jgi:4a-hydroxytetrahydrobiopterin dehydratase
MGLADKHCVPCRGGVPRLQGQALEDMKAQVAGWQVVDEHHLEKTYLFPDFRAALDFVNRVGAVAEQEGHHPDLHLSWGKVAAAIWTHKINGLTESDFILAAKIDELFYGMEQTQKC